MAGLEMRRPVPPCACSAPVLTPPAPPRVVDPGEPVIIAWVGNILDPLATRQVCTIKAGATLGDALRVFVPLARPALKLWPASTAIFCRRPGMTLCCFPATAWR